jgi:hypothetical protein
VGGDAHALIDGLEIMWRNEAGRHTFSVMRIGAVIVAVGCAAVLSPVGAGTGAPACQAVPPKTVSPTKSRLWTAANQQGAFLASPQYVNPDGSIWLKAPWWAAGPPRHPARGPRGVLHITGTRLDTADRPLSAQTTQVGVEGFGGSGVWAAVITFPSEGCWRVRGRVNRTTYTFRLLVSKTQ